MVEKVKIDLCYCNSERCMINRGLVVKREANCNSLLHKDRCCKPCREMSIRKEKEKMSGDKEMKGRSGRKKRGSKGSGCGSKNKEHERTNNDNSMNKGWNFSTKIGSRDNHEAKNTISKNKITKNEKSKMKENGKIKASGKNMKTKSEKRNKCDKETKSSDNEGRYKTSDCEDKQTIYVSYSMKGFVKIRTNDIVQLWDKYNKSGEVCDECYCGCIIDIIDDKEAETWCACCENMNEMEDEYDSETELGGCCCCSNRCLCFS